MAPFERKVMQALFVDIAGQDPLSGHSTKGTLFSSDHYHVWVHIDHEPDKKGPMHKHSADEIFYCVQGECTIHFPDGDSEKLKPGMLVVIPKDQFYQLHNTGSDIMILLGSRGEPSGKKRHNEGGKVIKNVEGKYVVDADA
jgi:mannose-6-phosphate isomerase-like protein (cupin superfamily)